MEDAAAPHVQAAYRYLSRDRPRAVPAVCVCVNVNVSVIYRSQLSTQSVSQSHSHINQVPLCGSRTLHSSLCSAVVAWVAPAVRAPAVSSTRWLWHRALSASCSVTSRN